MNFVNDYLKIIYLSIKCIHILKYISIYKNIKICTIKKYIYKIQKTNFTFINVIIVIIINFNDL